jgi:hypothetical protein
MWESREQFEQYAREQFHLQRHLIRLLEKLLEQGNSIEGKVDTVATNVLISQQSLQDLVTADQNLDAQVLAVLAYLQTITSNPPNDTAQLQAVTTDVNARVTALIAGLQAAQGGNVPPAVATVSIVSDQTTIAPGGTANLTVTATNASGVTISGTDGSSFTLPAAGGTQAVTPPTTVTYTATAAATSGSNATATVTVNVSGTATASANVAHKA